MPSSLASDLQRILSGARRFLACSLLLAPSMVAAQEALPEPAPDLYGGSVVSSLLRQSDGKVIAGGTFTSAAGQPVRYVARYAADGTFDASYLPALDGWIDDMAIDSLDRLYVLQCANEFCSSTRPAVGFPFVRRIDAAGDIDASFTPPAPVGTSDAGLGLLLDEAGSALYATYAVVSAGSTRFVVRRHHLADGSVDEDFELETDALIRRMLRVGDHIVLMGSFRNINGVARKGLARVDRLGGALDLAWDPAATSTSPVNNVGAVVADGTHLIVGGTFQNIGGGTNRGIARVSLVDGSADAAWNTPITGMVSALSKDSQGRVIASGTLRQVDGVVWDNVLARFLSDGQHDAAWNDATLTNQSTARSIVVLPNDEVLSSQSYTGDMPTRLLRHAADSGLTSAFAGDLLATPRIVSAFALGDELLLTGTFLSIDGVNGVGATRIDGSGAGVAGWRSTWGNEVNWVQAGGAALGSDALYLGSSYIALPGGVASNDVAVRLLLVDGAKDAAWRPVTTGNNSRGQLIALDEAAGHVYIKGQSLGTAGAQRDLARFDLADGTLDASWGPGPASGVQQMQIAGDHLYVAGFFPTLGGIDVPRLARIALDGNGVADAAWRPAPTSAVAIAVDAAGGWIYAGGSVDGKVELSRHRLVDGTQDVEWAPLAGKTGSISRLVVDADSGSLYAIGDFAFGCDGGRLSAVRLYSGANHLDTHWRVELDRFGSVLDLLPRDDAASLVVGTFERINGEARQSVAALGASVSLFADGMGTADGSGGCVR